MIQKLQKLGADHMEIVHRKKRASMESVLILAMCQVPVIKPIKSVRSKNISQFAYKVRISGSKCVQRFKFFFFQFVTVRSNQIVEKILFAMDAIVFHVRKICKKDCTKLILSLTEHDPLFPSVCGHCPPGLKCDILTGACIKGIFVLFWETSRIALLVNFLNIKTKDEHLRYNFLH
jgi:hypothetical protein